MTSVPDSDKLREVGRTTLRWLPLACAAAWAVTGAVQCELGIDKANDAAERKDGYSVFIPEHAPHREHYANIEKHGDNWQKQGVAKVVHGVVGLLPGLAWWAIIPGRRREVEPFGAASIEIPPVSFTVTGS